MTVEDDTGWPRLIQGLRDGDARCAQEFWDRFGPPLQQLAEKRLNPRLRRRVSSDSIVNSACRTFLRRAKDGEYSFSENQDLWRLLCAITLNKVREQARYHSRQKRGVSRETHDLPVRGDDIEQAVDRNLIAREPTVAEATEFADYFDQLLVALDDEERQVVDLILQDQTHEQIGDALEMSARTVRRVFKRVKDRLARTLHEEPT